MKALNVAAVVLLAVIALGIFTIPRFNYEALVARQTKLEKLSNALIDRLRKIDLLAGPKDGQRGAALEWLDQLPALIAEVKKGFGDQSEQESSILEELAQHRTQLHGIEERLRTLEAPGRHEPAVPPLQGTAVQHSVEKEKVELPEELAKKAAKISPRGIVEMALEDFVYEFIQAGFIQAENAGQVGEEDRRRLGRRLDFFKLQMSLIQAEQALHFQELVESRTRAGDFLELPERANEVSERLLPDEVGVRVVKLFPESGVKRVFQFPIETYPEIEEFNAMRDEARDRLVRDVTRLALVLPSK